MPHPRTLAPAVLAFAFAGPAAALSVTDPDYPRRLETTGPVAVSWGDPAAFTEIRYSHNRFEAVRGDWVRGIASHLARRAGGALAAGERLHVEITDIDRAGEYEPAPGRSGHVRVVRDIYPPRIGLRYTLYGTGGDIVEQGERRLTGIGFLGGSPRAAHAGDPLRHEKRLVDDWIRRDRPGSGRGD